jgi:hypothetical protein
MSIEIRVVPLGEILRTDVRGVHDFASARDVLGRVAEACDARPGLHVLLDAREVRAPSLTPADVFSLVKLMEGWGIGVRNRLAILYRPRDAIDRGRLFALCAAEQGVQLAAFQDFEAAIDWLAQGG